MYLASYIVDPFIFSFHFKPLVWDGLNAFQSYITYIFLFDIVMTPFYGVTKDDNEEPNPEDEEESSMGASKLKPSKTARMRQL